MEFTPNQSMLQAVYAVGFFVILVWGFVKGFIQDE